MRLSNTLRFWQFLQVLIFLHSICKGGSISYYEKIMISFNPIAYWNFDYEVSGDSVAFDSIQNFRCNASGGVNFGRKSLVGLNTAAKFNQTMKGVLRTENSAALSSSQKTLLSWIQVGQSLGTSKPVVTTRQDGSGYVLECTDNGKWAFVVGNGSAFDGIFTATNSCVTGDWVFLAATYDNDDSSLQLFVNGALEGAWQNTEFNFDTEGGDLFSIGGGLNTDGEAAYFQGAIDEVAVLSSVISTCDVLVAYENITANGSSSNVEYKNYVLSLDPLAYWNFEDVTSKFVIDQSMNGHDANVSNACSSKVSASTRLAASMQFDRLDESEVRAAASDDWEPEDLSVVAWVRPSITNNGTTRPILSDRNAGNRGFVLECTKDNRFGFYIGFKDSQNVVGITSNKKCIPNEWIMVAATFDQSESLFTFHFNGEWESEKSYDDKTWRLSTVQPMRIGAGYDSDKEFSYFHGKIDEVAIFDWKLTHCEVHRLYEIATSIDDTQTAASQAVPYRNLVFSLNPARYWGFNNIGKDGIISDQVEGGMANVSRGVCTNETGLTNAAFSVQFHSYEKSWISVPGDRVFSSPKLTVVLWFKPEGEFSTSRELVSSFSSDYKGFSLHCHTNDYLRFYIGTGTSSAGLASSSAYCDTDEWHMVMVTYQAQYKEILMYVDGHIESHSLNSLLDESLNLNSWNHTSFKIGAGAKASDPTSALQYWYGSIDEVAIYDSILTTCDAQSFFYAINGTANPDIVETISSGYYKRLNIDTLNATAYWDMESLDGQTVTDEVQGLPGNFSGGACPNRSSYTDELGHSVMFYEHDYGHIEVPCKDCFDYKQLSVAVWAMSAGDDVSDRVIVSTFWSGYGWYFECSGNRKVFRWNWGTGDSNNSDWSRNLQSETTCEAGAWHFLVGTIDQESGILQLYVDAKLEVEKLKQRRVYLNSTQNFFIGGGYEYRKFSFNTWYGKIDEVAIFDHILSAEEIGNIYNASQHKITDAPTNVPTTAPTESPTGVPSLSPSQSPTSSPTERPTLSPTASMAPTESQTLSPTSSAPTFQPTDPLTAAPTVPQTTSVPTPSPTSTFAPTTLAPTLLPTTSAPSDTPTLVPTTLPTIAPTQGPTEPLEFSEDLNFYTNISSVSETWATISVTPNFDGQLWYACVEQNQRNSIDYSYVRLNGDQLSLEPSQTTSFDLEDLTASTRYSCYFVGREKSTLLKTTYASFNATQLTFQTAPEPPQVESAQFSSTGGYLIVTFDKNTDQGSATGLPTTNFDCDLLFSLRGSTTRCTWISYTKIFIYLNGYSTVMVGDNLQLLSQKLKAHCDYDQDNTGCSYWSFGYGNSSIMEPTPPLIPMIVAEYSPTVSKCSDITLGVSETTGSGGRDLSVTWGLLSPQHDLITQYLENFEDQLTVTLPNSYITGGANYTFNVTVANFFGNTASAYIEVDVSGYDVPQLSLDGPTYRQIWRFETLSILATGTRAVCPGDDASASDQLKYVWESLTDSSLNSTSVNARYLKLPSHSLDVLRWYSFKCTVYDLITGLSNTETVHIYVKLSSISASFVGGNIRSLAKSDPLALEVFVEDLDQSTGQADEAFVTYSWSCWKDDGAECGISDVLTGKSIHVANNKLEDDTTYYFIVNVTASFNRTADFTGEVYVATFSLPRLKILTSFPSKVNADDKLSVLAKVILDDLDEGPATSQWTASSAPAGFAAGDLESATSTDLTKYLQTDSKNPHNFVVMDNQMVAPAFYTFRLTAFYDAYQAYPEAYIFAEIEVETNEPPSSGTFTVTPMIGYAVEDTFDFFCSGWVDIDLPLFYSFLYTHNGLDFVLQIKKLSTLHPDVFLPQGIGLNYSVTTTARIYDVLEASTRSTKYATVLPPSGTFSDLSDTMETLLDESLETLDPDETSNLVYTAMSVVNGQNCTLAPDCESLNRKLCGFGDAANPHTCGDCLDGYFTTDYYSSNTLCEKQVDTCSNLVLDGNETGVDCGGGSCPGCAVGESCNVDTDCEYNLCSNQGACKPPLKQCTIPDCSGRGNCTYFDYYGAVLEECREGKACNAYCVCERKYKGFDGCEYDAEDFIALKDFKELMINSLVEASEITNLDEESLNELSGALTTVLSPITEVTKSAQKDAVELLGILTAYSADTGELDSSTAAFFTEGLSLSLESHVVEGTTLDMHETLFDAVDSFGFALNSGLIPGEDATSYSDHVYRISAQSLEEVADANIIAVEERNEEKRSTVSVTYGSTADGIFLDGTEVALSEMVINPYVSNATADNTSNPSGLVRLNTGLDTSEARRRLAQYNASYLNVTINITNYFEVNYTAGLVGEEQVAMICNEGDYGNKEVVCNGISFSYTCSGIEEVGNLTCTSGGIIPECKVWNLEGDEYAEMCSAIAYDEVSTTCVCMLYGFEMPLVNQMDISVVTVALGNEFVSTWEFAEVLFLHPDQLDQNYIVIITLSIFMGIILSLLMVHICADLHKYLFGLGAAEDDEPEKVSIPAVALNASHTPPAMAAMFQGSVKFSPKPGIDGSGSPPEMVVIASQRNLQGDAHYFGSTDNSKSEQKSLDNSTTKKAKKRSSFAAIGNAMQNIIRNRKTSFNMPDIVTIQMFKRTRFKLFKRMKEENHWFQLLNTKFGGKTRFVNAAHVAVSCITLMAVDALIYDVAYPDIGPCSSYTTLEECFSDESPYDKRLPVCTWDVEQQSCYFNSPPITWETVIFVAIITYLIYLPLHFLICRFINLTIERPLKEDVIDDEDPHNHAILERLNSWEKRLNSKSKRNNWKTLRFFSRFSARFSPRNLRSSGEDAESPATSLMAPKVHDFDNIQSSDQATSISNKESPTDAGIQYKRAQEPSRKQKVRRSFLSIAANSEVGRPSSTASYESSKNHSDVSSIETGGLAEDIPTVGRRSSATLRTSRMGTGRHASFVKPNEILHSVRASVTQMHIPTILQMVDPTLLDESHATDMDQDLSQEFQIELDDLIVQDEQLFLQKHGDSRLTQFWYQRIKRNRKALIRSHLLISIKAKAVIRSLQEPNASYCHIEIAHNDCLTLGERKVAYRVTHEAYDKRKGVSRWVHAVGWLVVISYLTATCFYTILFGIEHTSGITFLWLLTFLLGYFQDLFAIIPVRVIFIYRALPAMVTSKANVEDIKNIPFYCASQLVARDFPKLQSSKLMKEDLDHDTESEIQKLFKGKIRFMKEKKTQKRFTLALIAVGNTLLFVFSLLPFPLQDFIIDASLAGVGGMTVAAVWSLVSVSRTSLITTVVVFGLVFVLVLFRHYIKVYLVPPVAARWKDLKTWYAVKKAKRMQRTRVLREKLRKEPVAEDNQNSFESGGKEGKSDSLFSPRHELSNTEDVLIPKIKSQKKLTTLSPTDVDITNEKNPSVKSPVKGPLPQKRFSLIDRPGPKIKGTTNELKSDMNQSPRRLRHSSASVEYYPPRAASRRTLHRPASKNSIRMPSPLAPRKFHNRNSSSASVESDTLLMNDSISMLQLRTEERVSSPERKPMYKPPTRSDTSTNQSQKSTEDFSRDSRLPEAFPPPNAKSSHSP